MKKVARVPARRIGIANVLPTCTLLALLFVSARVARAQVGCDYIDCAEGYHCVEGVGCVCNCPQGQHCEPAPDFISTICVPNSPEQANSTIPISLSSSPDGLLSFVIVLRDLANNPIPNAMIYLRYGDCASFTLCPQTGSPPDDYIVDIPNKTILKGTNGFGQAIFHLRAGGGCQDYPIRFYVETPGLTFFGTRSVASTDQDGDQVVDAADVDILQSKVGSGDLSGDLSADGIVDENDLAIQQSSLGNQCVNATRATPTTWGRVKAIYR